MKRIAQHFIMSKMADHITSGSCYYTTSGNDATAITRDDAIFCDRFSHFLSLYLRLLVFHHCCAML